MAEKLFYDAVYPVLALLLLLAALWRVGIGSLNSQRIISATATWAGLLSAASLVVLALVYLLSPHYSDLVQAQVVIISTNFLHGLPIHPDWRAGEGAYSSVYGPLLYELVAGPIALAHSLWSTKLAAFLAFVLTFPAMAFVGWKLERRWPPFIGLRVGRLRGALG